MVQDNELTLKQKIAAMLMFGFRGSNVEDQGVVEIVSDITKLGLGGVLLFNYNVESPNQLTSLTSALKQADPKILIAVDQEGGKVQRLSSKNGFRSFDTAKKIAKNYSLEEAYSTYFEMAKILKNYGINFNFAPCVDVDTNPTCSVIGGYERSFSDNPETVIHYSKQFIDAHKEHKIVTTLKHFPGHGYARGDTHQGLVDMTNSANPSVELKPYQELFKESSYIAVMTAHIKNYNLDPEGLPATMSKEIITGLLREKLGFQGVVVTDALEMGAIKAHYKLKDVICHAINAGNDILVFTRNSAASPNSEEKDLWDTSPEKVINIIELAISNGDILKERIDESYARIIKLQELINTEQICEYEL